ncbi:MAG: PIN domain-containing protein [Candidatus Heimdallarchaeota archaeon]
MYGVLIILGEGKALKAYAQLKHTKIISLDENLSHSAVDVSLKFGMTLADSVIYTTAKRFGAKIITSDPHFEGKNGEMLMTK